MNTDQATAPNKPDTSVHAALLEMLRTHGQCEGRGAVVVPAPGHWAKLMRF